MVHVDVTDMLALFQTSDIHLCCSRNWSDSACRTPQRNIKKGMCWTFGFRLGWYTQHCEILYFIIIDDIKPGFLNKVQRIQDVTFYHFVASELSPRVLGWDNPRVMILKLLLLHRRLQTNRSKNVSKTMRSWFCVESVCHALKYCHRISSKLSWIIFLTGGKG